MPHVSCAPAGRLPCHLSLGSGLKWFMRIMALLFIPAGGYVAAGTAILWVSNTAFGVGQVRLPWERAQPASNMTSRRSKLVPGCRESGRGAAGSCPSRGSRATGRGRARVARAVGSSRRTLTAASASRVRGLC